MRLINNEKARRRRFSLQRQRKAMILVSSYAINNVPALVVVVGGALSLRQIEYPTTPQSKLKSIDIRQRIFRHLPLKRSRLPPIA